MRRCQFGQRNIGLNTAVELPHCDGKDAWERGLFWKRAWDYWKRPTGHSAFLASAPLSFSRRAFGSSGPFLRRLGDLEDGAHSGGEVMLNFGPKSPSVCSGSQSCSWLRSSEGLESGFSGRKTKGSPCWGVLGDAGHFCGDRGEQWWVPLLCATNGPDPSLRLETNSRVFFVCCCCWQARSSNTSLTCAFCSRSETERRRRVWGVLSDPGWRNCQRTLWQCQHGAWRVLWWLLGHGL